MNGCTGWTDEWMGGFIDWNGMDQRMGGYLYIRGESNE